MKKFLLILASLLGEAIIVLLLLVLRDFYHLPDDINWLNIVTATLAYIVLIFPYFSSLANFDDKAQRWVGSLGITLAGSSIYLIATAGIIFFCNSNVPHVEFLYQLIAHMIVILIFVMSRFFARTSFEKVGLVYDKEEAIQSGIADMRRSMDDLMMRINCLNGIPENVKTKISNINDSFRYISPIGTPDAFELESRITNMVNEVSSWVGNYPMYAENIDNYLNMIEALYQRRKNIKL